MYMNMTTSASFASGKSNRANRVDKYLIKLNLLMNISETVKSAIQSVLRICSRKSTVPRK